MNRALGHFCAHTGKIGPGEPPEDVKRHCPQDTEFEFQTL